ncbi:MAG TPA: ABC transporter permease [Halanaerobiales bacterium]|nr:ABC transporter permease [Halanaerobiales bacterium]
MDIGFMITSLEQGLIYGIMAIGVYITFRILDFADLTVDGSLTLGAAVSSRLIIMGYNPFLTIVFATIAGGISGSITGFLNTRLKIAPLLSGILTMTCLWSINLRIMGRPNIPLLSDNTIFDLFKVPFTVSNYEELILILIVVTAVLITLILFLKTRLGYALRATGDNPAMVRSMAINTENIKMIGLILANSFVALSGSLVAQYQSFSDISMGIGTIIAGLASVIIGEVIIGKDSLSFIIPGIIIGSILYRASISFALMSGFAASDLKLLTALIVIIFLSAPKIKTIVGGKLNVTSD